MAKAKQKSPVKKTKSIKPVVYGKRAIWFEQHFAKLGYGILGIALLLRVWLLIQLPSLPFSDLHKSVDLDMNFFDQWGDRIAKGDMLTDTVWHPYHFWHRQAAQKFGLQTDEEGKAKWNEWYGQKTYHQEPLYAFIIGLTKMFGGNGHVLLYLLQIISSLGAIWMIMWLGRHYFGAVAGISAGFLFTFYHPALLFDVVILRTSFTTCYIIALLFVAERLMIGKSKPWLFGLLGGIGYLLQTTSILLWLPLLLRWLYVRRTDVSRSWQTGLAFLAVLGILMLRNGIVGAPLLSASSVGPVTYVLSNFPTYKPEYGFAFFPDVSKLMEIAHGQMLASMSFVIGMHASFLDWVNLEFQKLFMVFHWYEVPNNINTYLARRFSLPIQLAFIPWSVIGALGLTGMILNFRQKRTFNLLIGILSQVVVMVVFYVLCRFRIPMVAMMCIYGGFVFQQLIDFANTKRSWLIIGCSVAMLAFMLRPFPNIKHNYLIGELALYFHSYYKPRLDEYSTTRYFQKGIELEKQFISSQPDYIKNIDAHLPLKDQDEKDFAKYYANLWGDLGDFYRDAKQEQLANEAYQMEAKLNQAGQ